MGDPLSDALTATIDATRNAERELFGGLDATVRRRPIREGDWDPKDVQAHLTAWKDRQADRFAYAREGRALPAAMDRAEEDALNAELRAARLDWSWDAVVEEADAVARRLIDEVRRADPDALRASDRLIVGTFANGILHTLTHLRWLLEAGVPLDRDRVARFTEEAERLLSATAIPEDARAVGLYDLACFHALGEAHDAARRILREAFRFDPKLVEYSTTDDDLVSIRDELEALSR